MTQPVLSLTELGWVATKPLLRSLAHSAYREVQALRYSQMRQSALIWRVVKIEISFPYYSALLSTVIVGILSYACLSLR